MSVTPEVLQVTGRSHFGFWGAVADQRPRLLLPYPASDPAVHWLTALARIGVLTKDAVEGEYERPHLAAANR